MLDQGIDRIFPALQPCQRSVHRDRWNAHAGSGNLAAESAGDGTPVDGYKLCFTKEKVRLPAANEPRSDSLGGLVATLLSV
jgi:hypothetical protein